MLLTSIFIIAVTALSVVDGGAGRGGGRRGRRGHYRARILPHGGDQTDCMTVQQQCSSRTGCSIALSTYMLSCGPVVHGDVREGEEGRCTLECRNALVTLLSMDDRQGEVFMTCHCNGNEMCEEQKRRLEVCHEEVIHELPAVMDNHTDISCTLAQLICSADTSCYTALFYYKNHCEKLMLGERCTAKCKNAMNILYSQRKASKLRTCLCDGTEMYNCIELRENTEALCRSRGSVGHPSAEDGEDSTEHSRHDHDHITLYPPGPAQPYTPEPPGWADSDDKDEDEEDERDIQNNSLNNNYVDRRQTDALVAHTSAGVSSHTVKWNRGLIWILQLVFCHIFVSIKFVSSSHLLLLLS